MAGKARHPTEEAFLAGDSLRALACGLVFFFHAAFGAAHSDGFNTGVVADTGIVLDGAYGWVDHLFEVVPLMVYIFFSLSGYLLSRRFVRSFVEGTRQPSIRNFLRNRALRILPAFWFAVALSFLTFGVGKSSLIEVLAVPLCLQVYIQGPVTPQFAHAWTVDTEWALYLGLPLAAFLIPAIVGTRLSRRGRYAVLIGALAAVYVACMAFRAYGSEQIYYQRAFWAAGWSFIPGIGLAVVEVAFAARWRGAAWGPRVALGLMAVWTAVAILYAASDIHALGRRAVLATAATTLLIGAPLVLQWTTGRCWRVYDNLPLRWLGERSYSFYLLHFLIGVQVARHLTGDHARRDLLLTVPISLGLTLVAAALSYRFVEVPFLTRKARQSPTAGARGPAGVAGDNVVAVK